MIPYGRQDVSNEDIIAVTEVLRSEYLTQGPIVPRFEKAIENYCKVKYSVATNSATSALHIACLALGLRPNDHIWTSPITFVASANCGIMCGAKVDFVDIDPATLNMDPIALAKKLHIAELSGNLPKIVIPVHFAGLSCDMRAISILSKKYGFKIIEDASHAIGGSYGEKKIGSCEYSDITVFSFHPVKVITSGEGGMAVTNDETLAEKMNLLRSHGITRDPLKMFDNKLEPWAYEQHINGFNYRLTDIHAALGLSQLSRVDNFVSKRHNISNIYDDKFKDLPLTTQYHPDNAYSGMHLFVIRLKLDVIKKSRLEIYNGLKLKGVGVNVHYKPVYLQPFYKSMGFQEGYMPKAEAYYREALTIPLFPGLLPDDQTHIINSLREVVEK